jgi:LacI family transcriptional regulator
MEHRPVTIKDLARILNISVSTVSRALRDTYDVNQETRDKVMSLAQELHYKRNLNATGLARGGTHNIGIILPNVTNYFFSTVITGVQEVAYSNDYNITLYLTNDSAEKEREITQNLFISGLDGLLVSVSSASRSCDHFQQLIDKGIPVVFFASVPSDVEASRVSQDGYHGAVEAVTHLVQNGYKRIAHIAGPRELAFTQERLDGYFEVLKKYELPVHDEWIIYSGFSQEAGERDTYRLLELEERPDAIFAINDRKAVGAMVALKNKDVCIGKEIGVIGFTDEPVASLISPSLTTIAVPAFEIGETSCDLLLQAIFKASKKRPFSPQRVRLPGELIVRESTSRN